MQPGAQPEVGLGGMIVAGVVAVLLAAPIVLPLLYSLLWAGPRARLYPIAARNLVQHRRRTFLLGGAIAGVTALLVFMLGLSAGVKQTMLVSATTLMSGHVNVGGFFKVTAGAGSPLVTDYEKVRDVVQKELPELDYIAQRGRGYAKLVSDTASTWAAVYGLDIANEPGFREVVQLQSGNLDGLGERNSVLIFEEQAKRLEVKVGDVLTMSAATLRGTANTADLRVVAIAKNIGLMSQFAVFTDQETLRTTYQLRPDTTGVLQLYLKDIQQVPQVKGKVRTALASAGYTLMDESPEAFFMKFEKVNGEPWTGQKLDVTTWQDEIAFISWVLQALDALIGVLMFILLVIIAVGIMNTLWIAIRERTREIGTLRAIGMQRRYVMATFVIEAFTLSIVSTVIGAVAGALLCLLLNEVHIGLPIAVQLFLMSDHLTFTLQPGGIFGAIALITFCTTTIALIPSYLAARMKPITAIHHIG